MLKALIYKGEVVMSKCNQFDASNLRNSEHKKLKLQKSVADGLLIVIT